MKQRADRISKNEMQSVIEFLGHDLLEGRAPGTRGGDLAEIYMKSLCKYMDLEPGNSDSYLQPFVMKGFSNDVLDENSSLHTVISVNPTIKTVAYAGLGVVTAVVLFPLVGGAAAGALIII